MPDLTVTDVRRVFGRLEADTVRAMQRTVTVVALAGEKQAKLNASNGAHAKGTKTPATKGQGPAVVTGNLRRNITHDRVTRTGTVFRSAVGVAAGADYGKYVEGLGYVFMKPVVEFLRNVVIPQAARSEFGKVRTR